MNYFLIGGEFNNKGAEAMTFVAVWNIFKYDKDAIIYIYEKDSYNPYDFGEKVHMLDCPLQLLNRLSGRKISIKTWIKEFIKIFIPWKKSSIGKKRKVEKVLKTINVMIDISGYHLSSKWGKILSNEYCDWINLLKKNGAKVFLMPQSFGPFDYNSGEMVKFIADTLSKCDIIFAREKDGYNLLLNLGLNNVTYCYDSVLLENEMDRKKIILNYDKYFEELKVDSDNNIAIVPNYRLLDKTNINKEKLIDFYCKIISDNSNNNFYLISHAKEDIEICKIIKNKFQNNDRVIFIDHVLCSFNYENFVNKMNFIIASRYHSIVHAYKENVPSIIIGWAKKYDELASTFNQNDYLIALEALDESYNKINQMFTNYREESVKIRSILEVVQKNNCYSFLRDLNENK